MFSTHLFPGLHVARDVPEHEVEAWAVPGRVVRQLDVAFTGPVPRVVQAVVPPRRLRKEKQCTDLDCGCDVPPITTRSSAETLWV